MRIGNKGVRRPAQTSGRMIPFKPAMPSNMAKAPVKLSARKKTQATTTATNVKANPAKRSGLVMGTPPITVVRK